MKHSSSPLVNFLPFTPSMTFEIGNVVQHGASTVLPTSDRPVGDRPHKQWKKNSIENGVPWKHSPPDRQGVEYLDPGRYICTYTIGTRA